MLYKPDQPIQEPDYFVGRHQETRRILHLLKRSQSVSVVGEDRIGKTSLLQYVAHESVSMQYGLAKGMHIFVYINSKDLAQKSRQGAFNYIAQKIRSVLPLQTRSLMKPAQRYAELKRGCRRLRQDGIKLILQLDHFDVLTDNPQLDIAFYDGLRVLGNPQYEVSYLTASYRPLHELRDATPSISGSPFFNIFQGFELGNLYQDECIQLLNNLFQYFKAQIPSSAVASILQKAKNHPNLLQGMGQIAIQIYRDSNDKWDVGCDKKLQSSLNNWNKFPNS